MKQTAVVIDLGDGREVLVRINGVHVPPDFVQADERLWGATWQPDLRMVQLAKHRQPVLYLDKHNHEHPVTLIAWRGQLGNTRCRIEHRTGRQATVPTHLVRPIPQEATR